MSGIIFLMIIKNSMEKPTWKIFPTSRSWGREGSGGSGGSWKTAGFAGAAAENGRGRGGFHFSPGTAPGRRFPGKKKPSWI
jgi:hypothetical protein